MQNSNSNIIWKNYEVTATLPDSVKLQATITYSKKIYSVRLTEPIEISLGGAQLPYGLPLMFVTTEASMQGVTSINLIERTKDTLLTLYAQHKLKLNTLNVKRS